MSLHEDLEANRIDAIVSAIHGSIGGLPIIGNAATALIVGHIKNQRIDRLAEYVRIHEDKLAKLDFDKLEVLCKNPGFLDLSEDGYISALTANTEERKQYISSIVFNGIDENTISYLESRLLLSILKELNDIEIIWLRYFLYPGKDDDFEFREKHKSILERVLVSTISDDDEKVRASIQNRYKEHLSQLNLIYPHAVGSAVGNLVIQNEGQSLKNYRITALGKRLLKQIGL